MYVQIKKEPVANRQAKEGEAESRKKLQTEM